MLAKSVFKPDMNTAQGAALWREIFGQTKEDRPEGTRARPVAGGLWDRTSIAQPAATKRLIQALRSMAPGGWSDDRWEETKALYGVAYVAIDRICRQYQQAEFQVFVRDTNHPDGKRPILPDDGFHREEFAQRQAKPYDLVQILQKPNRQDSFGKMLYRMGQQLKLTGTALTWMVPNAFGVPCELYTIPTAIAIPQPAINPDFPDGYYRIQPVYPYGPFSSYPTPSTAVGAPIPAQWMLRSQYPHPLLRYDGFSPLTAMRLHMDEVHAIDNSRWYKMQRSSNPDAVLNFDGVDGMNPLPGPEIDRIHAEWENEFQGPHNAGKLIVGTPGGKFEMFGGTIRDMDYQDGWNQLVSFIMGGGFGITKEAADMIDEAAYATLFAALKQLHLVTIKPDLDDIAADLTRNLGPFYGDDLIVEIYCPRIDDHEINFQKADKIISAKCGTKNEVRKLLGLPVVQDEWGNDIAGDPSQLEQEQQKQEFEQSMAQMKAEQAKPEAKVQGEEKKEGVTKTSNPVQEEEPEGKSSRPQPDRMGAGSMGPGTKMLAWRKSLLEPVSNVEKYEQFRKAVMNGHYSAK